MHAPHREDDSGGKICSFNSLAALRIS